MEDTLKQLRETATLRLHIKEIAQAQGYTMSSLSRASRLSRTTIQRLWKPSANLTIGSLIKVSVTLQVSLASLVELAADEQEEPNIQDAQKRLDSLLEN